MAFIRKSVSLNEREIVQVEARPLPVILMLDISGSMSSYIDGEVKIDILNRCVKEMLNLFSASDFTALQIQCQVITFGGTVKEHIPLKAAKDIVWSPLNAGGGTPMGMAFDMVGSIIEDKTKIGSRAYRPAIILVSDGIPTDNWTGPLKRLIEGRGGKADRMALFIGDEQGKGVISRFLGEEHKEKFFTAKNAKEIINFFNFITMSTVSRARSVNPNLILSAKEVSKSMEDKNERE